MHSECPHTPTPAVKLGLCWCICFSKINAANQGFQINVAHSIEFQL